MKKSKTSNRMTIRTAIGKSTTSNEIPYVDRDYSLADEGDVCGGGEPMDRDFLVECIKAYFKSIDQAYQEAKKRDDKETLKILSEENIAITLGKESLMLLLSQKDCEGIRFYFCKNPLGRNSVAAVGVRALRDSSGKLILHNDQQVAQDIGIVDQHTSILATKNLDPVILNMEVGPPYEYAALVAAKANEDIKGIGDKSTDPVLLDLAKGLL